MGYFNEGRNRFGALILILLGAVLAGCDEKGGKTTDTDSAGFTTLAEKKAFLEQYVTFRRNYEELDFDISFIDGGDGRVPGPTEWDVRVRAKVPSTDLADWVSGMTMTNSADKDWVSSIPHAPIELDAFQWYDGDGRLVGISPDERIVLYRNLSN